MSTGCPARTSGSGSIDPTAQPPAPATDGVSAARTSFRLLRGSLGSGRFRIALEIVITLTRQAENATEVRAVLAVVRDGEALGVVQAGKNAYTAERQVSNEVGIRSDLLTGEDLFVIAEQVNADGSVYVRAFVKPLVNLIWLAGLVFVLGALITLWPYAREQRRLATRYEGAEAPART